MFLLFILGIYGIAQYFLVRHCIGLYKTEIEEYTLVKQHQISRLQHSVDLSNKYFEQLFGKINGGH